jgi:thiol-disulfide isomerase/thioredoxin
VEAGLAAQGLSKAKIAYFAAVFLVIFLAQNSYAVNIHLRTLDNQLIQTSDPQFKDRLLFVTVFQSNCDYCRLEVSSLNKLYEDPKIRKWFVIFGIDPYDSPKTIAQFKQSVGASYNLFQANPTDVFSQLHTQGTPTSYVILNGKILSTIYGEYSYLDLKHALNQVIDEIENAVKSTTYQHP